MRKTSFFSLVFALVFALFYSSSFCAYAKNKGFSDHPLLSGMQGFEIDDFKVVNYDRGVDVAQRPVFECKSEQKCTASTLGFDNQGHLVAEGKVTTIHYESSARSSPESKFSIIQNYTNAVQILGGQRIATADAEDYSVYFVEKQGRKVWILLTAYTGTSYWLHFIEAKPLEQSVKVGSLENSLIKTGRATLYINFDTNKATIRPDAKPTLDEILVVLKKIPALKISIEGHTDNVGNAGSNKVLSQNRAKAIVQNLVASGVDLKRLVAKGWGSEKPIAPNIDEAGRAKNRRVELVRMQ